MRRHQPRVSNFAGGLIGIAVIAIACYVIFGGRGPFVSKPFVLKAVFTSQTQLHIPSPVRIAGVDVGQVVSVKRISGDTSAATVTMNIGKDGLPIHADATAKIRARIFLEGNFYVDLAPGSPSARILSSGATLPAANTAGPVQLDRVLASLTSSARSNLQTLLQGIGGSLNGTPTAAEDASQDPIVRGMTGGQALNKSLQYSVGAFKGSAIVNQALLGQQPHDLSKAVEGNQQVLQGFARSGDALSSLVHTFNATMATLASRQQDLQQTIALLPPLLRRTETADTALDRSFGPTQQFARELLPGVKQLGPTIDAALPWIAQATQLVSPSELGGLLADLTPAVQNTGATIGPTKSLLSSANQLARCFIHNLIPTGNTRVQDPPNTTGLQLYQELFQSAVGLAGASGNFDGNGRYIRSSAGGGDIRVQTPSIPAQGPLYGNAVLPVLGTRPAFAGPSRPPLRRDVACYKNPAPNLNAAKTGAGP
jgi:phospholipid/cholesterol/gamma-HCH transport system substrate-binding protein